MLKRFLQQLKTRTEGFSLIEIMVAIVIMGIVLVPVCNAMLSSVSVNRSSNEILQARLAVSSAVESMMAEGVKYKQEGDAYVTIEPDFSSLSVTLDVTLVMQIDADGVPSYYDVTVKEHDTGSKRPPVKVETHIRAVEQEP